MSSFVSFLHLLTTQWSCRAGRAHASTTLDQAHTREMVISAFINGALPESTRQWAHEPGVDATRIQHNSSKRNQPLQSGKAGRLISALASIGSSSPLLGRPQTREYGAQVTSFKGSTESLRVLHGGNRAADRVGQGGQRTGGLSESLRKDGPSHSHSLDRLQARYRRQSQD